MVNKSKGTITRLTSGTAKILATGEISDVCEKKSRSNGVRPNAMKICTFAHSHLGFGKRGLSTSDVDQQLINKLNQIN